MALPNSRLFQDISKNLYSFSLLSQNRRCFSCINLLTLTNCRLWALIGLERPILGKIGDHLNHGLLRSVYSEVFSFLPANLFISKNTRRHIVLLEAKAPQLLVLINRFIMFNFFKLILLFYLLC